jgi:hypothetical protein
MTGSLWLYQIPRHVLMALIISMLCALYKRTFAYGYIVRMPTQHPLLYLRDFLS